MESYTRTPSALKEESYGTTKTKSKRKKQSVLLLCSKEREVRDRGLFYRSFYNTNNGRNFTLNDEGKAGEMGRQEEEEEKQNYEERLTTLSDIELIRQQSENFVQLMFYQIMIEEDGDKRKEERRARDKLPKSSTKRLEDLASSFAKVEGKIGSVKKEIERRDAVIGSRLGLLHRAIDDSQIVVLSAELLRTSVVKRMQEKPAEKEPESDFLEMVISNLDAIIESGKEGGRFVRTFTQMNLRKGDWTEAEIVRLRK